MFQYSRLYEFYKKIGVVTDYLKNPLREELKRYRRDDFMTRIGFMPGSRKNQIKRNLPIMIEMMHSISSKNPGVEFNVILHSKEIMINNKWLKEELEDSRRATRNKIVVIIENQYQVMKNCDLLMISSGTASLEAVFMNIPQIFFNRPSFFDYYVFRHFLKIDEYNLANLYLNKKIITSFISFSSAPILKRLCEIDLSEYF